MKKLIFKSLIILSLIFSFSYGESEIPNIVVKDNPKAEITTVKTNERRKKPAELNIEVKKLKSQNLKGEVNPTKKEINFDLSENGLNKEASQIINTDKLIYATKQLEIYPSVATTNGRKKISNIMEKYKNIKRTGKAVKNDSLTTELVETDEENSNKHLIVSYTDETVPRELYVGVLNKNTYELEKIFRFENFQKSFANSRLGPVIFEVFDQPIVEKVGNIAKIQMGNLIRVNRRTHPQGGGEEGSMNFIFKRKNNIFENTTVEYQFFNSKTKITKKIGLSAKDEVIYVGRKYSDRIRSIELSYINYSDYLNCWPRTSTFIENTGLKWPDAYFGLNNKQNVWAWAIGFALILELPYDEYKNDILNTSCFNIENLTDIYTTALCAHSNSDYRPVEILLARKGELSTVLHEKRTFNITNISQGTFQIGKDYEIYENGTVALEGENISANELTMSGTFIKYLDSLNLNNITATGNGVEIKKQTENELKINISSGNNVYSLTFKRNENNKIIFNGEKSDGSSFNKTLTLVYKENGKTYFTDTINISITKSPYHITSADVTFLEKYRKGSTVTLFPTASGAITVSQNLTSDLIRDITKIIVKDANNKELILTPGATMPPEDNILNFGNNISGIVEWNNNKNLTMSLIDYPEDGNLTGNFEFTLYKNENIKEKVMINIAVLKPKFQIVGGSEILDFGSLLRKNEKNTQGMTWLTVDTIDEVEITDIKFDMYEPYIYLNGAATSDNTKRIKILKLEPTFERNKTKPTYYDVTVKGELEPIKANQNIGSYSKSINMEMYVK